MILQGSLEVNQSVLIGSFLVRISPCRPFPWKRSKAVYFLFSEASKCHVINYLLTKLARAVLENIGPRSFLYGTWFRSVRTATTSGQYSPVRPSRSVSKRLVFYYSIILYCKLKKPFYSHHIRGIVVYHILPHWHR